MARADARYRSPRAPLHHRGQLETAGRAAERRGDRAGLSQGRPGHMSSTPEHAGATASHGEQLLRDFSLGSAFALAFAFISPIVALYSIFPLGIVQVGSTFWLGFPVALAGQLLVAAVFAMLVSLYPYEGSIYQW